MVVETPEAIAEAVQTASLGRALPPESLRLLELLGLADPRGQLTSLGLAVEEAWWVERNPDAAMPLLAEGFKHLPATQALAEILRGRASLPVEGALYHLARHKLSRSDDVPRFRAFLSLLNALGLVAYSNKLQTVRLTMPIPSEPERAEHRVRVVEPDRPYGNVRNLRDVLRECHEYIWWCDPQFGKKGLEPLHDEADAARIREIRVLSGHAGANRAAAADFSRFKEEMSAVGIQADWLIVPPKQRTWHDRFIVTNHRVWNMPPINTLYKGDYSEISLSDKRPPFEKWWADGVPVDEWVRTRPE